MADQVTPAVDKKPEEIEREMLQTRESLTEKVTALENQVVGTVQTAADTISDTVSAVRSLVSTAPEAVSETVKQATAAVSESMKGAFDISAHVRNNPWAAVGVSALLGGIVGALTASRRPSFAPLAASSPPAPQAAAPAYAAAPSNSPPGLVDEFMSMITGKLKELAETAISSVSASVKSNIESGVPRLVDEAAATLTSAAAEAAPTLASRFDGRRAHG